MAKKPAGLIYGVDDKPPLTASALLGLQHVVRDDSRLGYRRGNRHHHRRDSRRSRKRAPDVDDCVRNRDDSAIFT